MLSRRLSLCLLIVLPLAAQTSAPPETVNGRLEIVDGQRTLVLWGTAKERGFAHGKLLARELIACADQDFRTVLGQAGLTPRVYERVLLKGPVAKFAFAADELEELQGMIEGVAAALPPDDRIVPVLGRPLSVEDLKAINTVGDWSALGCSTVAVPGTHTATGFPAIVRNFDYPAMRALTELQHVVVVRPSEPGLSAYVGVSHPGGIGLLTGLSESGVFVSIHDVPLPVSPLLGFRANVPRLCALRRFIMNLKQEDAVKTAEAELQAWPTLFGNNFLVATRTPGEGEPFAAVFEYDNRRDLSQGVTRRIAQEGAGYLACTNHHRLRGLAPDDAPRCSRYDRLKARAEGSEKFGLDDLKALVDQAALPSADRVQEAYRHGTLHQAIAETGPLLFHVRTATLGANIRDGAWRTVDVRAAIERARAPSREAAPVGR